MDAQSSIIDRLCDPLIKTYFLQLLDRSLSPEEKYQKFVEFCMQPDFLPALVPVTGRASGLETAWGLDELRPRMLESLSHAARRMQRSQHRDGGWGLQIEQSNFWHTAYAVMFLKAVQQLDLFGPEARLEDAQRRGLTYLEQRTDAWSLEALAQSHALSIYDISLMFRCFYQLGRGFFRRETSLRIYRSIDRLYRAQNEDGGWDASLWRYEVESPVQIWSEAGATSMAIQALAETHDARFQAAVEKGMLWLAGVQNPDGSWNDGSRQVTLPAFQISGQSSALKTADALQALVAGQELDIPLKPYRSTIDRAVNWLLRHQQAILDPQGHNQALQQGYSLGDYQHVGLTLETLLRVPQIPLQTLVPGACWLIRLQRRQVDDPEDGAWVLGHTARIGLSLARLYNRISDSIAFQETTSIP